MGGRVRLPAASQYRFDYMWLHLVPFGLNQNWKKGIAQAI
jgi:hypothetical protein